MLLPTSTQSFSRLFSLLLAVLWVSSLITGSVQIALRSIVSSTPVPQAAPRCAMCLAQHRTGMLCCCHRGRTPVGEVVCIARCDVHVHPWFGEIYPAALPACVSGNGAVDGMFAPAASRHRGGANYLFADGHVKWERYDKTIKPDTDQTCFGRYQALPGDPHG